jgi:LPXTG-site transpeptidase (sortase) family protein
MGVFLIYNYLMKKINLKVKDLKTKKGKKINKINPKVLKIGKILVLIFLLYLILAPFLPEIAFQLRNLLGIQYQEEVIFEEEKMSEEEEVGMRESRFRDFDLSGNRLVIPSIGVHIAVVEGTDESVLYRGAWRRPNTSTPDKGGNTVITGHRFHYIPPNNKTFYNLNKLQKNAKVFVFWNEKEYIYEVYDTFVVKPDQTEIEGPMDGNILTLYTCHPLWTADKRLVVRAKLLEVRD